METTIEKPNVVTDDGPPMDQMVKIHGKAMELQNRLLKKAPDPQQFMHLFQPMKFRKKHNKPFHIEEMKSYGDRGDGVFQVTTMRHAIMLGVQPLSVQFPKGTIFYSLKKDNENGRLTSDMPVEVYSQYIEFEKVHGDVLVGGLGLGMAAEMILKLPKVKSVTVVEKEQKLIDLIKRQIDPRIKIINADLFEYMHTVEMNQYDSAYFDIWYGTGESSWWSYVAPLYRMARLKGIETVSAWGESEMKWQLISALYTRSKIPVRFSEWGPYNTFVEGLKTRFGGQPPYDEKYDGRIEELISLYINEVGTPEWEATFSGKNLPTNGD